MVARVLFFTAFGPDAKGKKGIAYIDSEAASTQSGSNITETYLIQIHQIIDIATRYHTIPASDRLLNHLLSISEEEWMKIQLDPPESLQEIQIG